MKEKYKWLLVTSLIIILVAVVLGLHLKSHYDKRTRKATR